MLRIPGSIIGAIIVGGGALIRGVMESRERKQKAAADLPPALEPASVGASGSMKTLHPEPDGANTVDHETEPE